MVEMFWKPSGNFHEESDNINVPWRMFICRFFSCTDWRCKRLLSIWKLIKTNWKDSSIEIWEIARIELSTCQRDNTELQVMPSQTLKVCQCHSWVYHFFDYHTGSFEICATPTAVDQNQKTSWNISMLSEIYAVSVTRMTDKGPSSNFMICSSLKSDFFWFIAISDSTEAKWIK